jgi:arogenate dehydrogenase (NADP+)
VSKDYNNLRGCDLVFVCTPMNVTLDILDKLEDYLNEKTIVTDVCSLKEFVSKKTYRYKFIPSHPMAGTEHQGWDYAFPDLFEGATWAVTLKDDTSLDDFSILKSVIEELGANTVMTTPQEHDKAVALISHAPMLIAQALCKNIENTELAQKLASSGFRDTTRLALSNVEMANDMIVMNCDNIKDVVMMLNSNIDKLFNSDYKKEASEIKAFRQNLYQ